MKALSVSALLVVIGCGDGVASLDNASQAVREPVDHTCTLATLPTTCGVAPEDLPCCAVQTPRGEEQVACCPLNGNFVHKLCADGAPRCTDGGDYPDACEGLVCPPLSWPCTGGVAGCCNDCGQLGPRGCCIYPLQPYEHYCNTIGLPRRDICIGMYESDGRLTRVTVPAAPHVR